MNARMNARASKTTNFNTTNFNNSLPNRNANASTSPLPLSGAEETYTDLVYGVRRGKRNNNCYAWATGEYRNSGDVKLQPGNLSKNNAGRNGGSMDLGSCAALRSRSGADLRGRAYPADPDKPCRAGHYKIMAFLAPGEDYHWYKQHGDALVRATDKMRNLAALARALGVNPAQVHSPTAEPRKGDMVLVKRAGVWSHKQGFATGPMLKDACGKVIKDPRKACRDYGRLNYSQFCGAWCVRPKAGKSAAAALAVAAANSANSAA